MLARFDGICFPFDLPNFNETLDQHQKKVISDYPGSLTKKENKNHKESNQDLYVGVYVPFLIMCMYRGVCVRVNIYDIVLV